MRKSSILLAIILAFLTATPVMAGGNLNLLIGNKNMADDLEPLEPQSEIGLEADFNTEKSYFYFTTGILVGAKTKDAYYTEDATAGHDTLTFATTELYGGIKAIGNIGKYIHPYIGGGVAVIAARMDLHEDASGGTAVGPWVGGGVYVTLADHLNVGVNLRYSEASVELYGEEENVGGKHVNFLIGYHW